MVTKDRLNAFTNGKAFTINDIPKHSLDRMASFIERGKCTREEYLLHCAYVIGYERGKKK